MVVCYIAVGSNLGDRKFQIESAIKRMRTLADTKVRKVSHLIQTLPQGGPVQGLFLNGVMEIETGLTPYQLLQELQRIEAALGRVWTVINGPRAIDLDILTYGDIRLNEAALCIPHPRMTERDFVMVPLEEIAPELVKKLRGPGKSVKIKRKTKK